MNFLFNLTFLKFQISSFEKFVFADYYERSNDKGVFFIFLSLFFFLNIVETRCSVSKFKFLHYIYT